MVPQCLRWLRGPILVSERPMFRSFGSLVQCAHMSEAYVGRGNGYARLGCTLDTNALCSSELSHGAVRAIIILRSHNCFSTCCEQM